MSGKSRSRSVSSASGARFTMSRMFSRRRTSRSPPRLYAPVTARKAVFQVICEPGVTSW